MKKVILVSIFFFLLTLAYSQQSEQSYSKSEKKTITVDRKNVLKINTLAITFKNVSLIYERSIRPRLSATLGLGYKFSGREPKVLQADNFEIQFNMEGISGYSVTPSIRYYIKTCDPSVLDGFYADLYLRYTRFSSGSKIDYLPVEGTPMFINSDISLDEAGVGLQLGYQLVIKKRFQIDFMFFGPRYSRYYFQYKFDGNVTDEFLQDLSDYVNEVIDRFGYDYKVNFKPQGSKAINADFGFANMRFGLSIGYSF